MNISNETVDQLQLRLVTLKQKHETLKQKIDEEESVKDLSTIVENQVRSGVIYPIEINTIKIDIVMIP